jgi:hypothetical protein
VNGFIPDVNKLPPGRIVDLASDANLRLVCVLGEGVLAKQPGSVRTQEEFETYFAPGWITLVKYDREAVDDAAPMHGLGYLNLPQDLSPSAMHLSSTEVYVTASGYHFPFIDTEFEDQQVLLVFDRELRTIEDIISDDGNVTRSVKYSVPLNISDEPQALAEAGHLLFIGVGQSSVAVVSIADPTRPTTLRLLKTGLVGGVSQPLVAEQLHVRGDVLHVVGENGLFMFDVSKPTQWPIRHVERRPQQGDVR